jgi:hypothetical protein
MMSSLYATAWHNVEMKTTYHQLVGQRLATAFSTLQLRGAKHPLAHQPPFPLFGAFVPNQK